MQIVGISDSGDEGEPSDEIQFKTTVRVPEEIRNIQINDILNDFVNITWDKASNAEW